MPSNLDSKVSTGSIRKALRAGDIIECFWEIRDGKPGVYLALVTEVKSTIVKIRWLHEKADEDDVFVPCPFYTEIQSWQMKKVSAVIRMGLALFPFTLSYSSLRLPV